MKDLVYLDSVIISGDLNKYLEELEVWFRENAGDFYDAIGFYKRGVGKLEEAMKSDYFYWDASRYSLTIAVAENAQRYGFPFTIEKHDADKALELLKKILSTAKNIYRLQRINHSNLMGILEDNKNPNTLNLTNYAFKDYVTKIFYVDNTIRIQVFSSADHLGDVTVSFAKYANRLEGVEAECIRETGVKEDIPSLESLAKEKIRRSKLRVTPPSFEVNHASKSYSIKLSKAELEMLRLCRGSRRPDYLSFQSSTWSPYQGKKMVWNLFGILAIYDQGGGYSRKWYSEVFIPYDNREAIKKATTNGGFFNKTINPESMPVLENLYKRTTELKNTYGQDLYPQFNQVEMAKRTGMSKKQVRARLEDLTGVLAKVSLPYEIENLDTKYLFFSVTATRWFIPKARQELVKEILD